MSDTWELVAQVKKGIEENAAGARALEADLKELTADFARIRRDVAMLSFERDVACLLLHAAELAGIAPGSQKQWAAAQFCGRSVERLRKFYPSNREFVAAVTSHEGNPPREKRAVGHAIEWWSALGVGQFREDGEKRHLCVCNKVDLAEAPKDPQDLCRRLLETCEWHTGSLECHPEDVKAVVLAMQSFMQK